MLFLLFLGLSTITSVLCYTSEFSGAIVDGLRECELDAPGKTFMTDEGSGFVLAAQTLKKRHILCAKHKSNEIITRTAGLSSDERIEFMKDANAVIFGDFEDAEALNAFISQSIQVCHYRICPRPVQHGPIAEHAFYVIAEVRTHEFSCEELLGVHSRSSKKDMPNTHSECFYCW